MERYKIRTGIVLTEICGEQLLVAARALQDLCPFVTVVNETSAFLWQRLKDGASEEELERAVADEYEVDDPAAVHSAIESFLQQMKELNYVIREVREE